MAVTTPSSATSPRLGVLRMNEAMSSMMPSASRKIPAITASVARLFPGSNKTITPATMLSTPTSTNSHQPAGGAFHLRSVRSVVHCPDPTGASVI